MVRPSDTLSKKSSTPRRRAELQHVGRIYCYEMQNGSVAKIAFQFDFVVAPHLSATFKNIAHRFLRKFDLCIGTTARRYTQSKISPGKILQ